MPAWIVAPATALQGSVAGCQRCREAAAAAARCGAHDDGQRHVGRQRQLWWAAEGCGRLEQRTGRWCGWLESNLGPLEARAHGGAGEH